VSFVSTSVDRITPRREEGSTREVQDATGWIDEAPVVTEPFSDWVLSGDFPSGRPAWESAGARFVDDIAPWEQRKLLMLNGAHTLLAAAGRLHGWQTVAEAISDPACRAAVEALWDDDARYLTGLDVTEYRQALLLRFRNPRIVHRLDQIAEGGLTKLRLRVTAVARHERENGRTAGGCAGVIGAWIAAVQSGVAPHVDGSLSVAGLLDVVDSELAADAPFLATVEDAVIRWTE
jgi:fructuronate reductase